ncbi:hypothetical protein FOQG_09663 [Fusarium oxysporum f. sp. raphani 54005]|uniref:Sterigmatocystin biosynthesis monooxygenase stcW n=1 Tax=Fusarium oxysporum f. sp. raphani 54005 TaxID=1089458 RepID=X0BWW5_FUSOX|nr:hypothetical protein FOQG_09663 [Fusarium oxysporum f. sp. raphani 54005]
MANQTAKTSEINEIKYHYSSNASLVVRGFKPDNWAPIWEEPAYTPRRLRVVCVGAGMGGLTLAHKIKHELKLEDTIDLVIYEKNPDVGGTWYENRYPGVACDVPAHLYDFLFELNPDWSRFYAPGHEIETYIKRAAEKHGLYDKIQFNSKLTEAIWDESSGKWRFRIEQDGAVKEDEAHVFINAGGILNKWKWPDIEGLHEFKGTLLHTANWDNTCDWTSKKVAIIGNGLSGIQCVPAMQPNAAKVVNYVRSPTWISLNLMSEYTKDRPNLEYSEEEKKGYREDPNLLFKLRKELEANATPAFFANMRNHPYQEGLAEACRSTMAIRLEGLPDMAEKLIPDFSPGCRRLTPGDGYIEAFRNDNCTMCWDGIEKVTPNGIQAAGKEEEFDMIVCASGFDTNFIPPWKLVGRNGATLTDRWRDSPEAFLSAQVDGMPNYFLINGPNCLIAHGPMPTAISWTCDYILRFVMKMSREDIKSLDVKKDAVDDFNVWAQEVLKRTVWSERCQSWYKNNRAEGQVTAVYSGSFLHMKDAFDNVGAEHFDITYNSNNRFRCLGNGTSVRDYADQAIDRAYYLDCWKPQYVKQE